MVKHRARKQKLKGRERRLSLASEWVAGYTGLSRNLLKRYRAAFHIDWECAISELTALGVELDRVYLLRLRQAVSKSARNERKHAPITRLEFDAYHRMEPQSDDFFACIVGYTSGGAPYGVTWEEWENLEDHE